MPVHIDRSPFERAAREGLTSPRRSNIGSNTEKGWIDTFLSAVMLGASVTDAVGQAGVHITLPYKTRITDKAFKKAWKDASEVGTEFLEQEAARRAYHGTLKPVFHKGEECGFIREYSDTLMIFLLKARRPDKYREGIEDGSGRASVVNINIMAVSSDVPQPQLIEVTPLDSNQQDREGVPETVAIPTE